MTIYFRPCGDLAQAPVPRNSDDQAFLERLSQAIGITIASHEGVDYEDWMEPACLLEAAIAAGVEIAILPRQALDQAIERPLYRIPGSPCPDILIGRQSVTDPHEARRLGFAWPPACNDRANGYAALESFRRHAGRQLRLAHMPGDLEMAGIQHPPFGKAWSGTSLGSVLLDFAGQDCFVKQVYPAKALPLIRLHPETGMTEDKAERLFTDEVGFHIMRFEGDRDALLVQEIIPMTHETRFFVVDGAVRAAAPCIESHTPRQSPAPGTVLADIFELERNGGTLIRDEAAAQCLLAFARKVAAEICEETADLPHFVLDCAVDAEKRPLVIELNPIAQSGLYGIDAKSLFAAILQAAELVADRDPAAVDSRPEP